MVIFPLSCSYPETRLLIQPGRGKDWVCLWNRILKDPALWSCWRPGEQSLDYQHSIPNLYPTSSKQRHVYIPMLSFISPALKPVFKTGGECHAINWRCVKKVQRKRWFLHPTRLQLALADATRVSFRTEFTYSITRFVRTHREFLPVYVSIRSSCPFIRLR